MGAELFYVGGRTGERMDRRTDGRMDRRTDGRTGGRTDGWADGQKDLRTDGQIGKLIVAFRNFENVPKNI